MSTHLEKSLSPKILSSPIEYRSRFETARPYPHVAIDGFLSDEFFSSLIRDFPVPGTDDYDRYCVEDGGKRGSNYANGDVASFPETYRLLDKLISSAEFLNHLTKITGIPGLAYDPDYFGGGLRESRDRTFLPIHLDFNYHPKTRWHRRLNLLLYLNPVWQDSWGGAIQIHGDPHVNRDSLVAQYSPNANRAVIFETSERSWHGFSRLNIPGDIGRRAFSVYFYTENRPEGNVPVRNTEYVEPWIPPSIRPGSVLSESDYNDLSVLLKRRDDRIRMLYELRRGFDDKYSHLWKEYEYYLAKFRELEGRSASDGSGVG